MAERKDGVSDDTVSSMETFYRHLKSTPLHSIVNGPTTGHLSRLAYTFYYT
jgi:hypothetical protein